MNPKDRHVVLLCIDGAGVEYFKHSNMRIFREIRKEGVYIEDAKAMVPTVTNVNNVSIITGVYPALHGIFTNCYWDRKRREEIYMEDQSYIKTQTVFEKLSSNSLDSAILTSKDKLLTLLNRGAKIALSAEKPPKWITNKIGEPPNIYSSEVNKWLLDAALWILTHIDLPFIYIATTDYAMHKYPPESSEAKEHMIMLDEGIESMIDRFPDTLICITADHGMSDKKYAVDLSEHLRMKGVDSISIPTVKDRYIPHHSNLSGSAFIYIDSSRDIEAARTKLIDCEGVEAVLTRDEASEKFHLPREAIGDFFVLGKKDYVFGYLGGDVVKDVNIRSHGSLHEINIPILIYGLDGLAKELKENREVINAILPYIEGYDRL